MSVTINVRPPARKQVNVEETTPSPRQTTVTPSTVNVEIGTVTTLEPGASATVENVGTRNRAVLNFGLPRGAKGDRGDEGPNEVIVQGFDSGWPNGTRYCTVAGSGIPPELSALELRYESLADNGSIVWTSGTKVLDGGAVVGPWATLYYDSGKWTLLYYDADKLLALMAEYETTNRYFFNGCNFTTLPGLPGFPVVTTYEEEDPILPEFSGQIRMVGGNSVYEQYVARTVDSEDPPYWEYIGLLNGQATEPYATQSELNNMINQTTDQANLNALAFAVAL